VLNWTFLLALAVGPDLATVQALAAPAADAAAPAQVPQKARAVNDLKPVILTNKSRIFGCYDQLRASDPTLRGLVLVTWRVAPDGRTRDVELASSMNEVLLRAMGEPPPPRGLAKDARLLRCIRALDLRFPSSAAQTERNLSVPMLFGVGKRTIETIVLDADGADFDRAKRTASVVMGQIGRACLDEEHPPSGPIELEWTRLDGIDALLPVALDRSAWFACLQKESSRWKPFPDLVEGSVRMRMFVDEEPAAPPRDRGR
jgi:hypothetical protein